MELWYRIVDFQQYATTKKYSIHLFTHSSIYSAVIKRMYRFNN